MMEEGQLSTEQFGNIVRRLADPLWYRITSSPKGKFNKDFMEFLLQLPEDKRRKYLKELSKLKVGGAKSPLPTQPVSGTEPERKMEVIAVE